MQPAQEIHIDTSLIPDEVRDRLAAITLARFLEFTKDPANVEFLDKRIAAEKARAARERS